MLDWEFNLASFLTLVQDVPPLDVPELLACLVRQSEPFLDQIGVRKGKIFCFFLFMKLLFYLLYVLSCGWLAFLYHR